MEKTIQKKVPLKVREVGKLKELLYNTLAKNSDVQIYVEKSLYDEIRFNFFDYNMSPEADEVTSGHYVDYAVNTYEFQDKKGRSEGIISFTANCTGFMQVVKFKMDRINYIHYNEGIKTILFIYEEKTTE